MTILKLQAECGALFDKVEHVNTRVNDGGDAETGERYEGEFHHGKRHGRGRCIYGDG